MQLAPLILDLLDTTQLAWFAETFAPGVRRRSRKALHQELLRNPEVTPEVLLDGLYEPDVKRVCQAAGVSSTGRRSALIRRLLQSAQPTFVALDFETADNQRDSACSVALVRVDDGQITRKVTRLIRPPRSRVMFTSIHGLTWQDLRGEPTFGQLWPSLSPLLDNAQFLAAHNAPFDRSVLEACCRAAGLPAPALDFRCTVKMARAAWDLYPTRLPDVCRHLGIPLRHHEAGSDAEACARIVLAVRETELQRPRG